MLRHQLRIISRRGNRSRYRTADRAFLAAASRLLPRERWSAFLVCPDTLTRWRRQLVSRQRSRRRRGPGRPPIDPGVRDLILRMARENPRWGYLRIKGELLKLGITVSATTIANVLRRGGLGPAPRRIGPTWSQFLRAQGLRHLGHRGTRLRPKRGSARAAPDASRPRLGRPTIARGRVVPQRGSCRRPNSGSRAGVGAAPRAQPASALPDAERAPLASQWRESSRRTGRSSASSCRLARPKKSGWSAPGHRGLNPGSPSPGPLRARRQRSLAADRSFSAIANSVALARSSSCTQHEFVQARVSIMRSMPPRKECRSSVARTA